MFEDVVPIKKIVRVVCSEGKCYLPKNTAVEIAASGRRRENKLRWFYIYLYIYVYSIDAASLFSPWREVANYIIQVFADGTVITIITVEPRSKVPLF